MLRYYEIKYINDPCLGTLGINPKEYIETYENENVNKKHKGHRNDAMGMDFENYSKRINSVRHIENFAQLLPNKQKQNRFAVKSKKQHLP